MVKLTTHHVITSLALLVVLPQLWVPASSASAPQAPLAGAESFELADSDLSYFRDGSLKRYEDSGSPIYSPTLPSFDYLDQSQREIGRAMTGNLSNYFQFVDDDESVKKGLECRLKPWTNQEKADVVRILDCVIHRAPGIVRRTTSGGPIKLCRVSTFKGSTVFGESNSALEESAPLAAAHESTMSIALSDRFFRCDQQGHGFVHELVHLADLGGRTAFSKEWAAFALPEITKIRKKTRLMSYKQMANYQKELRSGGQWPSLYASVNLREALAEYLGEYVIGTGFVATPEFVQKVGVPFLNPSKDEIDWLSNFRTAMLAMGAHEYTEAVSKFQNSIKVAPWCPMPYLYTAHCMVHGDKDYTLADNMIGKAISCFDAAGIPALEPDTKLLVPLRAAVLAEKHDYNAAVRLLDQLLTDTPNNREALILRSWCQFYRGLFSQSASDYYLAHCNADDISWALFNAPASRAAVRSGITGGAQSVDEDRRSITDSIKQIETLEKQGKKKVALSEYNATIKKIEALERKLAQSRIAK